ncbi:bacteriohemerythrin [Magnetococcus sp. PR-3]|uniref:bacteriohemerythrin n=1 Tax=Magnetococcus sp. PR-3 TaxID=3120355 RepID=UPI002FCE0911
MASKYSQAMDQEPEQARDYLRSKLPVIGVGNIDLQHRQLLDHIVDFHALVEQLLKQRPDDQTWAEIQSHFDFLFRYIREHLAYEEQLMESNNYIGFEAHKREHEDFAKKVESFKRDLLDKQDIYATVNVKFFLLDWLFSHTNNTDVQLKGMRMKNL